MTREIKVLIITGKTNVSFRQLPQGSPYIVRGGRKYHFFINDMSVQPDILVVRNKYIRRRLSFHIAPQNSILMLSEPHSVVHFPNSYCRQFGMLYSCQTDVVHHNVVFGPPLLPWFVGVVNKDGASTYTADYAQMSQLHPHKRKLISVITSSKAFTKGHRQRLDFVNRLAKRYGPLIDIYGRGINSFDDKIEALAPYRYHIAIENSASDHYWTEKISDCFLTNTYPIYFGCPNIADYFPKGAFSTIDINNFDGSCATIDAVIASSLAEERAPVLAEAKRLVLDRYNMFSVIADCCDKLDVDLPKSDVFFHPAKTLFDKDNFFNYLFARKYHLLMNCLSRRPYLRKPVP